MRALSHVQTERMVLLTSLGYACIEWGFLAYAARSILHRIGIYYMGYTV